MQKDGEASHKPLGIFIGQPLKQSFKINAHTTVELYAKAAA